MVRVTPIPNSSDKNTAGSISPDLSAAMMEIPITALMDMRVSSMLSLSTNPSKDCRYKRCRGKKARICYGGWITRSPE